MAMNLRIMMRRDVDVVHAAHASDLTPFCDPPILCTIELQDIDGTLLDELACLEARVSTFAAGQREMGVLLQNGQGSNIIIPLDRLFDPAGMIVCKTLCGLDSGLHIPGAIGIQH